jgi:hypothetical protein
MKEGDKAVLAAKQIEAATNAKNRLLAQLVTDTRVSPRLYRSDRQDRISFLGNIHFSH